MVGRDQFFEQSALRTRCRSAACLHLRRRSRGSAAVGTCAPESSRAEVNKSSASKDLVHVRPHPGPLSSPPTGGAADRLGETPWGNPHQDPDRGVAPLVGSFPTRPAPSQALTRLRQRILHLRWQTYPLRAPPSQLADSPWGGVLCAAHRYQASHEAVNREDTCPPQGATCDYFLYFCTFTYRLCMQCVC